MEILIESVKPLSDAVLELMFSNGECRRFDVKPYLDKGVFAALRDVVYFNRVQAYSRFVQWPGKQDFSLDTLWLRSQPVGSADKAVA